MTNPDNRLDRIERLVEQNAEQIASIGSQLDRTQRQVDLNSQAIQVLIQTSQQTLDLQNTERQQIDRTLLSINASLERIDRILDYLMRRDGDRPV
jgi:ABC-type transporter Mla subunit MlaD